MHCIKLLGQGLSAQDFDRQVAEFQVRVAVLNGFTALGAPITEAAGQGCAGKGEPRPSTDLRNRAGFRSQGFGNPTKCRGVSILKAQLFPAPRSRIR